jgi:hypothetical protein
MKCFIVILLSILFLNCKTEPNNALEWINEPPYNFDGHKLTYKIIPESYKNQYFAYLFNKDFFILEKIAYQEMTGQLPEKKYALAVRAIYTNKGGFYDIFQNKNNEISINYKVLGRVRKVNRDILLIEVDNLPSKVFISYTGAR